MIGKVIKIVLVISCMFGIFMFSNDNGDESTSKSDTIIVNTVQFVMQRELNEEEKSLFIDKFVMPVRKSAHFIIYLILGFLVINLLKEYRIINYKVIFISVFICFVYACSDEVHQLFVPGRSGRILDVFIDTAGSFVGAFIYFMLYNIMKKKRVLS